MGIDLYSAYSQFSSVGFGDMLDGLPLGDKLDTTSS